MREEVARHCPLCSLPQGYRQKDYFIATQGPLAHTVEDFWRMVWEWRCHTIVMLTEVQEREQVRCCPARAQGLHTPILPAPCGRCFMQMSRLLSQP